MTAKLRGEVASLKRHRVPLAVTLAKMSTRDMAASAMPEGLRARVMGAELDAAVALGCLVKMGKKHQATLKKLSMAQSELDKALAKVQPQTNWIEKCGKTWIAACESKHERRAVCACVCRLHEDVVP